MKEPDLTKKPPTGATSLPPTSPATKPTCFMGPQPETGDLTETIAKMRAEREDLERRGLRVKLKVPTLFGGD